MDIKQLSKRAMLLRNKYAALEKNKYGREWTNANIMEGFVGDVGDLMKLVQVKEGIRHGENVDEKLSHELSDCLWSILVLAENYKIDLEESFVHTMDKLETRIEEDK